MSPSQALPTHELDPLRMRLSGVQLIEASAGTGKTWTLAALYVRLVLGHGCADGPARQGLVPPQILVMTFTEAATAELRGRIRARLAQAARCFEQDPDSDASAKEDLDDFLQHLRASYPPAQWPACAQRLNLAAQWMDDAAIFTIHGWSSRMLGTHAFDSAHLFQQSRVEDGEQLKRQAAQDYWRRWYYAAPLAQLPLIEQLASSPERLVDALSTWWRAQEHAPDGRVVAAEAPPALLARWSSWRERLEALQTQARALWSAQAPQALQAAVAAKVLKGYPAHHLASRLGKLQVWLDGEQGKLETLQWFSLGRLQEKGWQEAQAHAVFIAIEEVCQCLIDEPEVLPALAAHAAYEIGQNYQQAKARLAQFDFSDLLQRLYHALQAPDGRLARAIAQQYPVALVDEFQDTDPWQYGALSKVYIQAQNADAGQEGVPPALILIGDPKQAIYSFRGADLATYLKARTQVQAVHTLSRNFRSCPELIAALNHVYQPLDRPFEAVPYIQAQPALPGGAPVLLGDQPLPALTVWHQAFDKSPSKEAFLQHMAEVFASQMVLVLQQGRGPKGPIEPADMAVLVRSAREARIMRQALQRRAVRSVYLSERDSVYASPEAMDLWRIVRAVANPRSTTLVRAAISTRLWGLEVAEMEQLFQDEPAWDAQIERFHRWQQVWQSQGFLPMLHQLLHAQRMPTRLLAQAAGGERALTNLLHLGDLLQSASSSLQGEGALLRYLEEQLQSPRADSDAAQLRLESDARLVQVVTMHKSKGLQYPLVFLPFVAAFSSDQQDDDQRLQEDMRLLYVALTRAQLGLWLGVAAVKNDVKELGKGEAFVPQSALARVLQRAGPDDLAACLATWQACPHIEVLEAPAPDPARWDSADVTSAWQPVRLPKRRLVSHWWTASFSALVQDQAEAQTVALSTDRENRLADDQLDHQPGSDSAQGSLTGTDDGGLGLLELSPLNAFPAGSSYGTLLHDLLQWQTDNGWPLAKPATEQALGQLHASWRVLLARKAQRFKLDEAQTTQLQDWLQRIIGTPLCLDDALGADRTLSVRLQDLQAEQVWAEMGFSMSVQHARASTLDQLIGAHMWPGQTREPLQPRTLEGMLVGFMDLVFEHQGRYFVLDYKSNRLPDYDRPALQAAMLGHRYDVQCSLYLLALHRLLKARLPGYDYARHMGGAVYWFVRGLDQAGAGLVHELPPRALIEAMDAVLMAQPSAAAGAPKPVSEEGLDA